jgi:hypothetical protein
MRLLDDFYFNYSKPESPIHKVFKQMVTEAVSNGRDPQKNKDMLNAIIQRHANNEFMVKLMQDVAPKAKEGIVEDTLMSRLNLIKNRCGVD